MSTFWPIWLGSSTSNPAGTTSFALGTGFDASTNSNVLRQTYINGFLDVSCTTTLRYDVSINGNLYIAPNKKIYANGIISNNDTSLNGRLTVAQDSSFNGNLTIAGKTIHNGDISMNGNVAIYGNLYITQPATNINVINTTVTNYKLVVTDDISLNGRISISQDASFNGNILVNPTNKTGTGFVGIGTTTVPTNYLQILGSSSTSMSSAPDNGSYHNLSLVSTKSGSTPYAMTLGVDYSTGYGYINCAGAAALQPLMLNSRGSNVNIGTSTANTSYTLYVLGQVGATSFNATSDYRIKENIKLLDDTFTVDNIKPVSFTNKLLNRQDIGMIAHEVEELYPYLVTGEKDANDYQTVNYTGFIGLLIHEVKQLKTQMKEMKAQIESLKSNI